MKHSLVAGEYNARREECAAAAKSLGAASLREITPERLQEARGSLDPLLYRRALHIVGENDRVWRAVQALRNGDADTVGQLMNDSHESSRLNFENSTVELDALTALARALPGVLGSRLTGGGFGGGTVSLVRQEHADAALEALRRHSPSVFVCRIADGAAVTWGT
jgi:galactokinase